MDIPRRLYPVDILTPTHKVEGSLRPIGSLMNALNDPELGFLYLEKATISPLRSALRPVVVPEMVVNKRDLLFIHFLDDSILEELRMFKRTERAVVYTQSFALCGDFHLGAEQQFRDMLDTMKGDFQPLTDVDIFPLFQVRTSVPRKSDLLLINIQAVKMYHPEVSA